MIAASGTPRFRSNSGHTLAGTRAMTIPETMARSEMGNLAQRLGAPFCVVICRVLGTVADELTLSTSTTKQPFIPSHELDVAKSETRPFPDTSATRVTVEQEGTKLLLVCRRLGQNFSLHRYDYALLADWLTQRFSSSLIP